eukprot:TRINITY_DN8360_c0_g1_i1.p1 TRINITY_DN8360_c0_g1~~TRINITY_DN8360_c0_g1_i1.p1  ORF type:complete len:333 (-),score=41.16 TRINITY_DN8360_c0_g1_i1:95-1024(-)
MGDHKERSQTLPKKDEHHRQLSYVPFLSGGIAGTFAKTAIAPLERVKILYQIRSKHYPFEGIFPTIRKIMEKEGIVGLWKGNTATVVRIFPYAAIQFFSYENYKRMFAESQWKERLHPTVIDLTCGSLAGATSVMFTYPLDLVRVRMAVSVHKQFDGIYDCIRTIIKADGAYGLFRGMSPTLMGIVPYAGVNFASFEALKRFFARSLETDPKQLPITVKLAAGGIAGAVGQTVAYPLDVVRRQMQTSGYAEGHGTNHKTTFGAIRTILMKEGLIGLFRGMSINYLRVGPQVAISFTTYETVKKYLEQLT